MGKVEVLVATMHQSDLSKFYEMNIQSDVIFTNQTNNNCFIEEHINNSRVRMISTNQRGVGRNRNLALLYEEAEFCLLGDDDIIYVNNYEQIVQTAFDKLPTADVIIFNVDTIGKEVARRQNNKIKRVRLHNFMNYGAVRIAFRRESIIKNNIWFSLRFGGGAYYGAGEDSLFLRDVLKKGLRIYTYPVKIADVKQETSTWFSVYNKKYFFDKGAFLAAAFPMLKHVFAAYFGYRYTKLTNFTSIEIFKYMLEGMKAFRRDMVYEES